MKYFTSIGTNRQSYITCTISLPWAYIQKCANLIATSLPLGRDGTEAFEDVGHSPDAREIQQNYLIGQLDSDASKEDPVPVSSHVNFM